MTELTQDQKLDRMLDEFEGIRTFATPEKFGELWDAKMTELKGENAEFVRKMQFGKDAGPFAGSKFARCSQADVDWLHSFMSARARVGFSGPSEALQAAFKDGIGYRGSAYTDNDNWQPSTRAMDTAESGYGAQLIGAQYVGSLWDVSRELGVIAPLFREFPMTAPTAYLPVEAGFPEVYYVTESTDNNSSNYSTAKTPSQRVSVTAVKNLLHQMWSGEMEEDSIIPFVPFLRMQAARAIAYYKDSTVLNGDTTNSASSINDSSDPADTKAFLSFDGLRHAAIVDNTGNLVNAAAAPSLDLFRALRATMRDTTRFVDWGHPVNRNDLVFIADPDTSDRIELLDDVINAKLMAGNSAGLLNGQVASILGFPVIRTFAQKKALATGFIHNSTGNDYGQLTAVNVTGGVIGMRREVKVEVERLPATDQSRIVYTFRWGFGRFTPTGAASGIEWVASARNITV